MSKRVGVALSGGVDSAVSAMLLKNQGYDVFGLTGKMICSDDFEQITKNASNVAKKLEIEHYVVDVSKEFNEKIIKYFEESYKKGETPNPCIMCNKFIKWGVLYDYALQNLGADYIATGHYANIKEDNGIFKLYPASDEHKDQLYFLFMLEQEKLAKTLFPLAKYSKEEVRKIACENDLPPKSSKESQDICFIKPPMTTKKYLNNLIGNSVGNFVEKSTGKILGQHNGFWQYTIGQRKGIGLAAPEPLYVIEIEPKTNTVYVGYKDELMSKTLIINNLYKSYPFDDNEFYAMVKIRYNMNAIPAKITKQNDKYLIEFDYEVSAIAKGQACVLYGKNDGHLLGGGWI